MWSKDSLTSRPVNDTLKRFSSPVGCRQDRADHESYNQDCPTLKILISSNEIHKREKRGKRGPGEKMSILAVKFSRKVEHTNPGRLNRFIGLRSVNVRCQSNHGVTSR